MRRMIGVIALWFTAGLHVRSKLSADGCYAWLVYCCACGCTLCGHLHVVHSLHTAGAPRALCVSIINRVAHHARLAGCLICKGLCVCVPAHMRNLGTAGVCRHIYCHYARGCSSISGYGHAGPLQGLHAHWAPPHHTLQLQCESSLLAPAWQAQFCCMACGIKPCWVRVGLLG
jgi:hypothetical protein